MKTSKPVKTRLKAKDVVDQILDRPIAWVKWQEMPEESRRAWAGEANAAISNRALQSLLGKPGETGEIAKRVMENIARRSSSHEQTENMRHILIGAELVKELLEEMLLPKEKESKEDLNAPI